MSTFEDIAEAGSALTAARRGLQLVAQSLAAADTECGTGTGRGTGTGTDRDTEGAAGAPDPARPGASDAVADLPSIALDARRGRGALGLTRVTELAVAARLRTERADSRVASKVEQQLTALESIFGAPGLSGLSSQLDELWGSCAAVADQPGSDLLRTRVLDNAAAVASSLNHASACVTDLVIALRQDLLADVDAANAAARQLAETNRRLARASEGDPGRPDLLDRRDALVESLAELVGATAEFTASGCADVAVAGQQLVSAATPGTLSVDAGHRPHAAGAPVELGGSASASVTVLTCVLARVQGQLDAVAGALSSTVNEVQAAGFDRSGTAGPPVFAGAGATGISMVLPSPAALAASASPGGNLDGSNTIALSGIGDSPLGPNAAYTQLLVEVSSAIAGGRRQRRIHGAVVRNLESLRRPADAPPQETSPPSEDPAAALLSSATRIEATSPHPAGSATAARLGHELARAQQYGRSAVDGLLWMAAADTAYARMLKLCRRARDLVRNAGTAAPAPVASRSPGQEINAIRASLLDLANTTYKDRPIFGGTTSAPIAYRADGSYAGDEGVVSRAVGPELTVQISHHGPQLFRDRATGDDLFAALADLAVPLAVPSGEVGAAQVGALDAAITRIAKARSAGRASCKRLKAARTAQSASASAAHSQLARVRDVDVADVVTTVSTADAGYRSALKTTADIRQLALLEFLG